MIPKVCLAALLVAGFAFAGGSLGWWELSAPAYGTEPQPRTDTGTPHVQNSGSVVSEGTGVISADRANAAGYTGQGVKVAVIDGGFDITNPEIARNVAGYRSFSTDYGIEGDNSRHGTAVAEIIVDVAPDVELYLYNIRTGVEFLNAVDHIIGRGDIDVVSVSVGWVGIWPADGTSRVAQKVGEARDSGILWVNAAGNSAEGHWQGQFSDTDGDRWHNFLRDDELINISVPNGKELRVILSWDDWDSPSQDFELCLFEYEKLVVCSDNSQPGSPPVEIIRYAPQYDTVAQIAIYKYSATRDVNFQLFSTYDLNEYAVAGSSITIPADSPGSLSVGAANFLTDRLAGYSSQGPTLGGVTKPDVTGPTGVATTAYPWPFHGTSASAPHVAGAAALVMEKYPDATADQVQALLESTVHSRHPKSNQDGTGRVDVAMLAGADILALDNSNRDCDPCFFPDTLKVGRGDTVTWVNADTSAIAIGSDPSSGVSFNSGSLGRGDVYSRTFAADGTFGYSDTRHPWATGQITAGTGTDPQPALLSAAITGPNQVTAVFSGPADTALGDFTGIVLTGENTARAFTALAGSGTTTNTLTFDGRPAPTDATASMSVGSGIMVGRSMQAGSTLAVADGQAPVLERVSVSSSNSRAGTAAVGDTVTLTFEASEQINTPAVAINGVGVPPANLGGNTWGATKTIGTSDPSGAVLFSVGFVDAGGNAGVTVTETTDGSRVSVVDGGTSVRGTVFNDTDGDGILDPGERGIEGYRMLAIDYATAQIRETHTAADGTYAFDNISPAPAVTLVQTWYYPPGTTVADPASSWFRYVAPGAGSTATFDVGFYQVPPQERVTLDILMYEDGNSNGLMDPGERGIGGLTSFYVYTYTTGPVAYPVPDAAGMATVDDLVPADFALLVFTDRLAESGYAWINTSYDRDDGATGRHYDPTMPVAAQPEPGSTHTMKLGLVPVP